MNAASEAVAEGEGLKFVKGLIERLKVPGLTNEQAVIEARKLIEVYKVENPKGAEILREHLHTCVMEMILEG